MLNEIFQDKSSFSSLVSNQLLNIIQHENTENHYVFHDIKINNFFRSYLSNFVPFTKNYGINLDIQVINPIDSFTFVPEFLILAINICLNYFLNLDINGNMIHAILGVSSNIIFIQIGTKNPTIQEFTRFTLQSFSLDRLSSRNASIPVYEMLVFERFLNKFNASVSILQSENGNHNFELSFPKIEHSISNTPLFNHDNLLIHDHFIDNSYNLQQNKDLPKFFSVNDNLVNDYSSLNAIDYHPLKNKIDAYIGKHIGQPFNIQDIANYLHISQPTLFRKWKEISEISLNNYIIKVRLDKVIDLVITKQLTLTQAAHLCAFPNSAYFSRLFKKFYTIPPREYIKKLK